MTYEAKIEATNETRTMDIPASGTDAFIQKAIELAKEQDICLALTITSPRRGLVAQYCITPEFHINMMEAA